MAFDGKRGTLRFWDYVNGDWVKLSVRPGQTLVHCMGGEHDEGWSREVWTWTHDGDSIVCTLSTDGTDCDGRHSSFTESVCHASRLFARDCSDLDAPAGVPDWQRLESSQRDYFAESMGY